MKLSLTPDCIWASISLKFSLHSQNRLFVIIVNLYLALLVPQAQLLTRVFAKNWSIVAITVKKIRFEKFYESIESGFVCRNLSHINRSWLNA